MGFSPPCGVFNGVPRKLVTSSFVSGKRRVGSLRPQPLRHRVRRGRSRRRHLEVATVVLVLLQRDVLTFLCCGLSLARCLIGLSLLREVMKCADCRLIALVFVLIYLVFVVRGDGTRVECRWGRSWLVVVAA